MNVIERAKAILLKPAETWPVIDARKSSLLAGGGIVVSSA